MNTIAECTVPEKILLAAWQLEEEGQSPFSAEALIVASWQKFPRTFGLKGYADQYPDSNKVLASIMGEKGLARRGWLAKMGQKLYSLSREGQQVVRRLRHDGDEQPTRDDDATKLTREQEKSLLGLLDSAASDKFQEGRKQEITFAEACRFWCIGENQHGETIDSRLNRMRAGLADLERVVGSAGTTLTTGRSISEDDLNLVRGIDNYLAERFGRHLSLLRHRAERV